MARSSRVSGGSPSWRTAWASEDAEAQHYLRAIARHYHRREGWQAWEVPEVLIAVVRQLGERRGLRLRTVDARRIAHEALS